VKRVNKPSLTLGERISRLHERWFIREPLMLMVLSSHKLAPDSGIQTIRSGKGRIEYNESYLSGLDDDKLERAFKAEVIRILLRHPYRYPPKNAALAYMASNITLNEYYESLGVPYSVSDFWNGYEYKRQNFEFYYRELVKLLNDPLSISADEARINAQNAELWQEDDFMDAQVSDIVERAGADLWGSIEGELYIKITAALTPTVDYRYVLSGFRASILSSKKILTRMKPSRRYGFLYMGQKYQFTTRLLVGLDVSGSINDQCLQTFYSTVNRFFKYGIERIDVQAFDSALRGEPIILLKARKTIRVKGRGGTDFEPILAYFNDNRKVYDGLIIFTDGNASVPEAQPHLARRIVWVCDGKRSFERHKHWMRSRGRCCYLNNV